ncbi:ComF family protein [candidate division KSB1 bacterium]|nr:ComF family protein [candidate division KSB1 bacterium]
MKLLSSTIDLHLRASQKGEPFFRFLATLTAGFLDFLYPPECLVCHVRLSEHMWVCPECESQLRESLDVKSQSNSQDFIYLSEPFHFKQIISCWFYSPEIETLVHHVKYHKGWRLGIHLGEEVGRILPPTEIQNMDCLVPVPLHSSRKRERGFNQSFLYCKGIQHVHPIPILKNTLTRNRPTATQTKLDSEARQANVDGAFRVKNAKSIQGKRVVLIDDVVTTGATMNACAKALLDAGAEYVTGLALVRPDVHFKPVENS